MWRLLIILCISTTTLEAQDVYKTIDENGNVIYTDEPPDLEAQPLDLPPLNISDPIPIRSYSNTQKNSRTQKKVDFKILSPTHDQSIWGTGATLAVSFSMDIDFTQGLEIKVLIDGVEKAKQHSQSFSIANINRGEHQVSAQLIDSQGTVISSTASVTFFMRQHSSQ